MFCYFIRLIQTIIGLRPFGFAIWILKPTCSIDGEEEFDCDLCERFVMLNALSGLALDVNSRLRICCC